MIPIKKAKEIREMRRACEIAAVVLDEVCLRVEEGMSTYDLNEITRERMEFYCAESTSFGYKSGTKIFPGYGCFSVNDEIVHGTPSKEKILKNGDIISIDLAMRVDDFVGDNTRTMMVGEVSPDVVHLIQGTEEALWAGINNALPGNKVGDISAAIQRVAMEYNLGIVKEFVGHGIGRDMHEPPEIPNYGIAHTGQILKAGMTLAIEPMLTLGSPKIKMDPDGWTVRTADGSLAAHSEHTILITKNGPEVLTLLKK